jgi:MFS family permease
MTDAIREKLHHNFIVNVLDACFFGFGLVGLASYVTIIPLYLSYLTDSTALIGFMATMFQIGWQVPQLLTSNRVAGLKRYKPMVIWMTLIERVPYFGLAIVAILVPVIGKPLALILSILMMVIQSFGGGFTATAWQSMISKIMPANRRGTFFGMQSAGANLFATFGALFASVILAASVFPNSFGILFFLAGISLMVSFVFLAMAFEPESEPQDTVEPVKLREFWQRLKKILNRDTNFRWFLIVRSLTSLSITAISFFTIFGIRQFNMTPEFASIMTSVLLISQTMSSPILGWIGDRWGHRRVLAFGNLMMIFAIIAAMIAPDVSWFYIVFGLTGLVNSTQWSTIMSITAQFGTVAERPIYIGMANTLIAPVTIFSPIIGGLLADWIGFTFTFGIFVVAGIFSFLILTVVMSEPATIIRKTDGTIVTTAD